MDERTQDILKVVKVIRSCVTDEQFDVANNMINAFLRKYNEPDSNVPVLDPFYMVKELHNELIKSKYNG